MEADVGFESGLSISELEDAAAGDLLLRDSVTAEVVADGVAAAVAAVDVVHLSVVQDVVAVVVVARDYCLYVPHLAELGKEA